jgi:uncharacterized protein (DUF4415 family)
MKRINPKDAHVEVLEPVTIRLQPSVVSEARERGEHVRGGASAVLRNWILAGKALAQKGKCLRGAV